VAVPIIMLVIRNQQHFDTVVRFARDHGIYDPDPSKPDVQYLKPALDRLESFERKTPDGQPTVRVVLCPDFAPHSFEFLVERSVPDGWEATLIGGLLFHGPHDGFGSGAGPTFAVSLTSTVGWSIHT
jgi:Domain of unknown function (DUF4120)